MCGSMCVCASVRLTAAGTSAAAADVVGGGGGSSGFGGGSARVPLYVCASMGHTIFNF